MLKPCVVKYYI